MGRRYRRPPRPRRAPVSSALFVENWVRSPLGQSRFRHARKTSMLNEIWVTFLCAPILCPVDPLRSSHIVSRDGDKLSKRRMAIIASYGGLVLAVTIGTVIVANEYSVVPTRSVAATSPSGVTERGAVSASSVQTSSVRRISFACKSPRGAHLNISYTPTFFTRFYFNNHCSQRRHIQIRQKNWPGAHTFVVNPHLKGNKTLHERHFQVRCGIEISTGWVTTACEHAEAASPTRASRSKRIVAAPMAHSDESVARVNGRTSWMPPRGVLALHRRLHRRVLRQHRRVPLPHAQS